MRKVDIERSRDYYKELAKTYSNCMVAMAQCFEKHEKYLINRINELEAKVKEKI